MAGGDRAGRRAGPVGESTPVARTGPHITTGGGRAVPAEGLVFGLSSHRAEHWWFFDGGTEFDSDVKDARYAAFYGPARSQKKAEDRSEPPTKEYMDDWLARTAELVDKYQSCVKAAGAVQQKAASCDSYLKAAEALK